MGEHSNDTRDTPTLATRRRVLAVTGATMFGGCAVQSNGQGNDGEGSPSNDTATQPGDTTATPTEQRSNWEYPTGSPLETAVETDPLVVNLDGPWDVAFTPTGELFVSERTGRLLQFDTDAVLGAGGEPIDANEITDASRQAKVGEYLQGIAVHPSYPDPSYLYVYYGVEDGKRVGRVDTAGDQLRETLEVLVEGLEGTLWIGGRIAFGPNDDLWVTTGTSERDPAQDPGRLEGSILRVTPEGNRSPANPDIEGGDPRVFSYGHRNPQGLAWLPDGTPVCTDHGPDGRDEVARLSPGANYGWPVAQGGPDDPEYESYADHDEFHPPLVNTGPDLTWAPAGCVFYEADDVPAWRHRLLVGTLRGTRLEVVTLVPPDGEQPPLDGTARRYDAGWLDETFTATAHRVLADDLGRIRHVAQAPDGALLAASSNHDHGAGIEDTRFPREQDDVLARIHPA